MDKDSPIQHAQCMFMPSEDSKSGSSVYYQVYGEGVSHHTACEWQADRTSHLRLLWELEGIPVGLSRGLQMYPGWESGNP